MGFPPGTRLGPFEIVARLAIPRPLDKLEGRPRASRATRVRDICR